MTQNIYDNPDFFAGYSQLGRSVEGLAGAAEWPALQAMLPPMTGLNVVDLGCGYGARHRGTLADLNKTEPALIAGFLSPIVHQPYHSSS